ncbi:MAG TPA: ABC transporter permease [Cyclobacteriaceae bacterium]|nr:ABC transporter permease [Cyclobacteriaceae bacterium]
MLQNFFKTAIRNMLKHKVYALINFGGLTMGIGLILLIMAYVRSENSFDQFQEKGNRLYRIAYTAPNGMRIAASPPPIAPLMTEFFPDVELAARVYSRNVSISHPEGQDGASFEESGVFFVDSALAKMFTFQLISGSLDRALVDPFTLIITDEMATKYFGEKNPLGESLIFGGKHAFRITAVVKDFPQTSHLRFHMMAPFENMFDMESDETAERMKKNLATNFVISHSYTYVLLKPGGSPQSVDSTMSAFLDKYCPPNRRVGQIFTLMAVPDIHLKSTLLSEPSATNTTANLYIFIAIGLLTLLIACSNYINLSTAQSLTRIKEIGIRKILGSAKGHLIGQFLAESFLFCGFAFVLAFGVFYLGLPLMNQFTGREIVFSEAVDMTLIVASIGVLVAVTALAGGYPAWFISTFNSVASLKGAAAPGGSNLLRKSLVVFQLMVACMLLSGSLMLMKQMQFLQDQPLGFQQEHIITVPLASQNLNAIFSRADSTYRSRLQTFRDQIEMKAGVKSTAASSGIPGLGTVYRGTIPEGFTQEDNLFIADLAVDYDFMKTYDLTIKAGRAFSKEYGTDEKEAYIVNETAVREFKWGTPEAALGKTINREGKLGKVVGVVNDFSMATLTTPMGALVMEIDANQWNTLNIRFTDQEVNTTLDQIAETWNQLFPEKSFEYSFLDNTIQQQYANDRNFGKIIQSFTLIAIIISCLGVYGLVLFVVQRKVKEIGVRKVLGAHAMGIVRLIYTEFFVLFLVGFVLAVPVSYYFIDQWLRKFTYHTPIEIVTFVISFLLVLVVMSLTISYQAIKASLANPVHSLRSE